MSTLLEVGGGGELPTEFLIFSPGVNTTENGNFDFTPESAESIVSHFEQYGVDLMIDLEHDSLDDSVRERRNDACDAMGWFRPVLRADGSLWAESVRWSSEGERRLRGKLQRFTSPAFWADDSGNPVQLINVALTSYPATHGNAPLVAASGRGKTAVALSAANYTGAKMDQETIKAALKVLEEKDGDAALAMLTEIVAAAASGEAPAEPAPAEAEPLEEAAEVAPEDEEMATALRAFTGKKSVVDARAVLETLRADNERLRATVDASENAERVELVGELVKLGVELPATAWADAEARTIAPRLIAEPIAGLRERVSLYRAQPRSNGAPALPAGSPDDLTPAEEAEAARRNFTPEQRKAFAALRASRRAG